MFCFYAKDVDFNLTKKLNYLLDKKTSYMIYHNVSSIELDSDEKMYSYFNLSDLQLVIQFILTQLIPAMQNENIDMDEKYHYRKHQGTKTKPQNKYCKAA